jgi:hypothetical protein
MAQSGGDIRLSRMLLDVASDLDAEAEAIEAEMMIGPDGPHRAHRAGRSEVVLGAAAEAGDGG